ncbi:flagellar basal body rod protein FlgF [Microbulbifer elongatus]|uniref:flagellar basal body rod protein FlgF n=1 Tax=Microbulbifer elongatus TaxID=86173 RepID=UPI001E539BAD|nr:flagellar basal body rod protein FlgF [Microbulbifer elongatus]
MDRLLYTAMSGARQSMEQQSVVSNNLANATTSGFRAQLYALRAVPVQGDALLATRTSVVASTPGADFRSGPVNATGRELDIALQGNAWLAVQSSDGSEAYTRRGDLQVDATGMLSSAGHPVMGENGPVIMPLGARISIGVDGTISAIGAGEDPEALVQVARLKLVTPDDGGLQRGTDGLFRAVPDMAGNVIPLAQNEQARLISGSLEGSNVSPVESMVAMIDNARRYDMQLKVIESADENGRQADSLLSLD